MDFVKSHFLQNPYFKTAQDHGQKETLNPLQIDLSPCIIGTIINFQKEKQNSFSTFGHLHNKKS